MGRWLFATAGVLALAVLLVGALVGGSPTRAPMPDPLVTPTGATLPSATPSAVPSATAVPGEPIIVWLARDSLPPIAIRAATSPMRDLTPEARIAARLGTLPQLQPREVLVGAGNELAASRTKPTVRQVRIEGDVAHVDWNVPNGDWGVGGSAGQLGLLQQLVYTATEEPGIRRVMLTENGGKPTTPMAGHGLPLDKPLAREDVFGYERKASLGLREFAGETSPVELRLSHSIDDAAALGRIVVAVSGLAKGYYPQFQVDSRATTDPSSRAKYELEITFPSGYALGSTVRTDVDQAPIRYVAPKVPTLATAPVNGFVIGIDDLRPWRAVVLFEPTRVVIDVGGPPYGISDDEATAVYAPARSASVDRTFRVRGVVRAFEATFSWRVRDARAAVIASGFGKANIGTAPVWGGYEFEVALPTTATGTVTLEIYQGSPRDGTEISVVRVPLFVR